MSGAPKPIEKLEDVSMGAILADRYEMIRELGAGGMGVVWLAHDRVRDEPVALKLLPRAVAHDPVAMVGIRREANLSLKLTHPNILRLLNLELAPFPFLLMEFVEGRSLQNMLAEKMETCADGIGRLTPPEVASWLPGLADGLDHAHKIGVIHRDIKPANIMLVGGTEPPLAKLTDFGIAAQLRDTATHLTQQGMSGTPVYMAPEQLKRKRIDKRVDVYALGVTIYQLLSGTLPFLSEYQIHNDPVPEIDGQTALMHEVLCKALARNPDERYQSAGELAADFTLVVAHGDAPIPEGGAATDVHTAHTAPAPAAAPMAAAPAAAPAMASAAPARTMAAPAAPLAMAAGGAAGAAAAAPTTAHAPQPMPPPITNPSGQPGVAVAAEASGFSAESSMARRLRMGGAVPTPTPAPAAPAAPGQKAKRAVVPPGFSKAGTSMKGLEQYRCDKDGSLMMLVPGGTFSMGTADGGDDEKPAHDVTVGPYLIDVTPITNRMFEKFVSETKHVTDAEKEGKGWAFDGRRFTVSLKGANWKHPAGPDDDIAGKSDYPVVQISWNDADAYAKWSGKALPTEAQWERAARGGKPWAYPWGDAMAEGKASYNSVSAKGPTKTGSYPANEFGLQDMAGNVWEWCSDWYGPNYYASSPPADPAGPEKGVSKVLRGGTWHGSAQQLRCGYRHRSDPVQRNSSTGFRCVVPLTTEEA